MIDWGLAEQIATRVAGEPAHLSAPDGLAELSRESEQVVSAYTGLTAPGGIPELEAVGRREWVGINIAGVRRMIEPALGRVGDGAGPLRGPLRTGAGWLLTAEVGGLVGYLSRHVLGQYELVLLDPQAPTRLLLVSPNLAGAARGLRARPDELLRWVTLHEVTHALQFGGVPWLREHLAGLTRELIAGLELVVDSRRLLRLPTADDLRGLVEAVRAGELVAFLAGEPQREVLERLQALMAVVEGHAEHVMDAVGADLIPSLPHLRRALDARRHQRPAPVRLLHRLLGLDLKLRQYEVGRRFCDEVVSAAGPQALERLWSSPASLPSQAELDAPLRWLQRTNVPSATS